MIDKEVILEMDIPKFKYHLDPIKSGVIVKEKTCCPVCNVIKEYRYELMPAGDINLEGVCPWCIADGSAAKKYDVTFINYYGYSNEVNDEQIKELVGKTPAYISWQTEEWMTHCNDFCTFVEYVGWNEIEHLYDELKEDIEEVRKSMDISLEDFKESLFNNGDFQGYLFHCCHCGKHRLFTDLS